MGLMDYLRPLRQRLLHAAQETVDMNVGFFRERGMPVGFFAERRWKSLLEPEALDETIELAIQLKTQATTTGALASNGFGTRGECPKYVMISVAPGLGDEHLFRAFPDGSYAEFLRNARPRFQQVDEWQSRDFAHWMFLWNVAVDVHLSYLLINPASYSLDDLETDDPYFHRSYMPPPILYPSDIVRDTASMGEVAIQMFRTYTW